MKEQAIGEPAHDESAHDEPGTSGPGPARPSPDVRWAWTGALACFVLAALTGALYRFGLAYGVTAGLDLVNIRHAHSHLMYFGWATPALMAMIATRLPAVTGRPVPRGVRRIIGCTFVTALLAYPLFAAFGYTPVAVGGARIPLSVIAASLNMIVWYGFVWTYARATRGVERGRALAFWDAALVFLVLATCGAWGIALLKPLGVESAVWSTAFTHIFLDYFAEGWFVLALLGLAYAALDPQGRDGRHWSLWALVLGTPVTFALGMPLSLVSPPLKALASAGGALVAVGLLANTWTLWKRIPRTGQWIWSVPLLLLALKAVAQGSVSLLPDVWWASFHGLRILYLHLMLLGFVSLGLIAAATTTWGREATPARTWAYASIVVVLLSLIPLTVLWPDAWRGLWAVKAAAWVAVLPVLAVAVMLVAGVRATRQAASRA